MFFFLKQSSTTEEVGEAGHKIFVMLYGGKDSGTLTRLRYLKYMKIASSSSAIKHRKLPPSERAAWFHSLRVFPQVQEWNSLMN